MPAGSKPGERRGGRAAGVPNKKTVAQMAVAKVAAKKAAKAPAKKPAPANKKPGPAKGTPKPGNDKLVSPPPSMVIADARAEIVAEHECDPVKVLLDLTQHVYQEFLRINALPGAVEVITLDDGTKVRRTAAAYMGAAHQLARDAAPYRSPKLANVAVAKTEDRNITIVVQRQGKVEAAHRVVDGVARDVTDEIASQIAQVAA